MKRIYKFPLQVTNEQVLRLQIGAQLLDVQIQHDVLCLWALVDTNQIQMEDRTLNIYGTGHPASDNPGNFIATVQQGPMVWHVFESKQQPE